MRIDTAFEVHTLLRVASLQCARFCGPLPAWLSVPPPGAGWVVVRRAVQVSEWIAAGMRGRLRSERYAVEIPAADIVDVVRPEDLVTKMGWIGHPRAARIPALCVLSDVAVLMHAHFPNAAWGPTGSVGLELASGDSWTTPMSDLDLMLKATLPLPRPAAAALAAAFAALPVRIDMLVETPAGGIALDDFVRRQNPWLLRTAHGPRLTHAPWDPQYRGGL